MNPMQPLLGPTATSIPLAPPPGGILTDPEDYLSPSYVSPDSGGSGGGDSDWARPASIICATAAFMLMVAMGLGFYATHRHS